MKEVGDEYPREGVHMEEIKRIVQLVAEGEREMGDGQSIAEAVVQGYLGAIGDDEYVVTDKGRNLLR